MPEEHQKITFPTTFTVTAKADSNTEVKAGIVVLSSCNSSILIAITTLGVTKHYKCLPETVLGLQEDMRKYYPEDIYDYHYGEEFTVEYYNGGWHLVT